MNSPIKSVPAVRILGIPVSLLSSYQHATEYLVDRVQRNEKSFCVAVNPEKIFRATKDVRLRDVLEAADLRICDGVGASLATRWLHGVRLKRITGVELFFQLIEVAEQKGLSVFFLGATKESVEEAQQRLQAKHPNLRIAGWHDGFFDNDAAIVDKINASGTDILFVAMGSPTQEFWIAHHRSAINAGLCMGIGGSLDVASGHAKWAPKAIRTLGCEFLYRLATDPKRWRRQLCLPLFATKVIFQKITVITRWT